MHTADIRITNHTGKVVYHQLHRAPDSWKELTREDLLLWASLMYSGIKLKDARIMLAALLFRIPEDLFRCIKRSMAAKLGEEMSYLFSKNGLNNWLIPHFRYRFQRYYGPKSRLVNLTVDEFGKCEECYEKFNHSKNIEYLDTLTAILYRPRRFFGINDDIRATLTTYGYVNRSKRFRKLPNGLKTAVYLNYEGCRNYLHLKYKEIFVQGPAGKSTGRPEITPWLKIIETGAGDIFGPMDSTENANLHKFLSRLNARILEAKKIDEQMRRS